MRNVTRELGGFIERFENIIPFLIILSILVYGIMYFYGNSAIGSFILGVAVVLGVLPLARDIIHSILRKHFGVDIIAILAITSAFAIGEYLAASVVLLMLSGGEALEKYAIKRAKKDLTSLLSNAPRVAHLLASGQIRDVDIENVHIGDIVVVKPGEVIPVDGQIKSGTTIVDESILTGESLPVDKVQHAKVFSGTLNVVAPIEVVAERESKESKYSHIIRLVQEAESSKAPFVRLADRYSVLFTAVSILIAFGAWVSSGSILRAVSVLVVATPCPLIIATPIAFASGISKAAKRGVILKNGGVIEKIAEAKSFMFDKTGTLTFGTPKITNVQTFAEMEEREATLLATSLDQLSSHILARAFLDYFRQQKIGDLFLPSEFSENLGNGVSGVINGEKYHLGRLSYMHSHEVTIPNHLSQSSSASTLHIGTIRVYLSRGQNLVAIFYFADTIRDNVKNLFTSLTSKVKEIVMLTGDKKEVAEHIASQAGIKKVFYECTPEDKVNHVKNQKTLASPVVMVGDGVNDAPALATADVGIAMGAHGSSAASESGDVVVMVDSIERIGEVFELSRRVLTIAKQSIFVGMGLSIGLMMIASLGYINPVYGALAQEVIDVVVILNALRVHASNV